MKKEEHLQRESVKWFRYAYPKIIIFAPMNEGVRAKVRSTRGRLFSPEGIKAKAMGKLAGVADLVVVHPSKGFHGLFAELKTTRGRQSEPQKEFQQGVESAGYKYVVCRTLDAFREEVDEYLLTGGATSRENTPHGGRKQGKFRR